MVILELIYGISLLVSMSVFSGYIGTKFKRTSITGKILQGILFGVTAIISLLYPLILNNSLFFDGRTIVISICTFFFGPIPGITATFIAFIYRLTLGGVGMVPGLLAIISSFLIGFVFYLKTSKNINNRISNLSLYMLGLVVHIFVLLEMLAFPAKGMMDYYSKVGFIIIGIYPVITLLIGKILLDQESKQNLMENLIKSETIFKKLIETSPTATLIYQGTKFVYINERSVELTGYPPDELIGKEFWSIVHPDFQELTKERGLKRLEGENVTNRYQFKFVKKSGEERWVDFAATTIEYENKPAVLCSVYDITDTVKSMESIQEQKDLFQTTIYSIGDGVIITDTNGFVRQMNRVAEQLTGYSENVAKGKSIEEVFEIINEQTQSKVQNPVDLVLAKDAIVGLANHTLLISKDKRRIPIADSGAPIKTKDGKTIGVVLVFRDQTEERKAERRILESETKFRNLVEHAFDGIYMLEDTIFSYVNDRFCEITGYKREELISETFDFNFLLTEKSKEFINQRYLARKAGEEIPVTYEFELCTKNGTLKEVELSTVSLGSKERISVIGIMRDITDRKKAEEELKEAKERMQILVEGTPHLFFYVQDKDGDVKYISPSVEKITGHTIAEWLGQGHWFTTDSPINVEARKRTHANLKGEINFDPIIVEIEHANGDKLLLEIYEKPIFEGSEVIGLQGVAHDVTKQKIAEEKLKEINSRLQTAIEGADIGIWDQDFVKGKVMRMGRWGEMLGYSTSEINKELKTWRDLIHPDDRAIVEKAVEEHEAGKTKDFKVEHRLKTSSGDYKWILNWGRIYERDTNGRPLKASGVHVDINDRKLAQIEIEKAKDQAVRANQLKSEFLAQISHEIRSPLNAILNFSQLLKEVFGDKINEETKISFDGIDSASKRVIRTVDLILNMSELQLGTYEVTQRKIDLVEMLSNIRKEYLNLAHSKKLELRFVSDLDKIKIKTDEYALNQIFANLVDNAIKYTKKGFVEISLEEENEKFKIKVSDSGVGISKEFMPEIFEAFSQEERGYSRRYEGSGLGLSLVKKYCDLIKADLNIESERGKGTTFTVTLG